MKIFSFFSGAGFLDLGFEHEGFDVVYVNEIHAPFLKAYKFARQILNVSEPEFGYFQGDIQYLLDGSRMRHLQQQIDNLHANNFPVGFIGGPPCPDFSVGGKNKGRKGDKGKLSASYVELICKQQPDFFLFENVKGLWRTKRHRAFYEELKQKLHKAGYYTSERLINAIEYGVPQDRDRIILIGFHKNLGINLLTGARTAFNEDFFDWMRAINYPNRTAFDNYNWPDRDEFKENSQKSAPLNIPLELTVEYWFRQNDVLNHPNAKHAFTPRAGLRKFKIILEGDDGKKSYKRLHRWRYSPTAAYGNNEVHLHPYKARRISAAEALAIQSLPSNFLLPPDMSLTNMFKTIGNGVPYLAAKGIAKSVKSFLGDNGDINEINSIQFSESHWQTAQEQIL
jgi:DNA (cytosine-5)-methyltransferase 1